MKNISLTNGETALVDDDVYEAVKGLCWRSESYGRNTYASHSFTYKGKPLRTRLHHVVIGYPLNGLMADHVDGDGLNNLRSNLRHVTARQNMQNRVERRSTGNKCVGAYRGHNSINWRSQIKINGKIKNLGSFKTEKEASRAYWKACKALALFDAAGKGKP